MSENNNDISDHRKSKYRNLLDEMVVIHDSEKKHSEDSEALNTILNSIDKLLYGNGTVERLGYTDDFLLDATLMEQANNILHRITHTIVPVLDTYNPSGLAAKIRLTLINQTDNVQNDQLEWTNLFEVSRKVLKVVPSFSYLCGFELMRTAEEIQEEKKPRERKERVNKNDQVATNQPERLANVNKEEDSLDDTVKFLFWALNKEYKNNGSKPVNYFTFVMDPSSFRQSVENCFHLSFLVRDARVNLIRDDDGMFVLSPVSSKESKRCEDDKQFQQYILSLEMSVWKRAVQIFNLRTSTLIKWKTEWDERSKQK